MRQGPAVGRAQRLRAALGFSATIACAWLCAAACLGCGARPAYTVERRVGGVLARGAFVTPYAYEWFVRGELAMAAGKYKEAAKAFGLARADAGDDPLLLGRLAEALEGAESPRSADRVLDEGLGDAPCAEALLVARGRILERRGARAAALRAFAEADACEPTSEGPTLEMARVYAAGGEPARALSVLERFLRRVPEGGLFTLRAELELALLEHDAERCLVAATRLRRHGAIGAPEIRRVAEALAALGSPEDALRLLETLPEAERPASLFASLLARTGDGARAEAWLRATPASRWASAAELADRFVDIGKAEAALEVLDGGAAVPAQEATRVRVRALLALGDVARAATVLLDFAAPSLSPDDARPSANGAEASVEALLGAGALPALGAEVGRALRTEHPRRAR